MHKKRLSHRKPEITTHIKSLYDIFNLIMLHEKTDRENCRKPRGIYHCSKFNIKDKHHE